MSQSLQINSNRSYRLIAYAILLFITSMVIGIYFRESYVAYIGFALIIISIAYEILLPSLHIKSITLPSDNDMHYKICIDGITTDFWIVKRHIIINGWIFLYLRQDGSNKKIKLWLHKSNFADSNGIRYLAKNILLNN